MTRFWPTRRGVLAAGASALAAGIAGPARSHGDPVEILVRSTGGGASVHFDPVGLRLGTGARVRWRVVDGVHTVTACHPANGNWPMRLPGEADPWASGYLMAGDVFDVHLTADGVYDYLCLPHEAAGMVGRLVVGRVDAEPDYRPGTLSAASLDALPSAAAILEHGRLPAGTRHGG